MKRDLGSIGETAFLAWCGPEGLSAQKSQADLFGWDLLLETIPDRAERIPLDRQNAMPKYLVQVKSSEHPKRPPRIKLSALKHLVDADLPAAIAVLFYDKDGRLPARRLLVPVNQRLIYETLKRVRKEESEGNRSIHKTSVLVDLTDAVELGAAGEGLATALQSWFGDDPAAYIHRKATYRETCGDDAYPLIGHFRVPGADVRRKLGDMFLGGRRELAVSDLTIEGRRFGIALPNDHQRFKNAVLEMDAPPLMSGMVELASADGEWVATPVDVFVVPPLIERAGSRVRFANEIIEVVLDFDKVWAEVTFDYNGERRVEFEEAVSLIEIGAIMARPQRTVTLCLKDVRLPLKTQGEPGPFEHWISLAPVLRRFIAALGKSRLAPRGTIKLEQFFDWLDQNRDKIATGALAGVNLFIPRWPEDGLIETHKSMLVPLSLSLLGLAYIAVVEIPMVEVSRDDREVKIAGGEPRIIIDAVRREGADTSDLIDAAVETYRREKKLEGPALIAGGFASAHA